MLSERTQSELKNQNPARRFSGSSELTTLKCYTTTAFFNQLKGFSRQNKIYFIIVFFQEAFELLHTIGIGLEGTDIKYHFQRNQTPLHYLEPLHELILEISRNIRSSYYKRLSKQYMNQMKLFAPDSAQTKEWKPTLIIDETLVFNIFDLMQAAYKYLISWHTSYHDGTAGTRHFCYRLGLILQICQGGIDLDANSSLGFQMRGYKEDCSVNEKDMSKLKYYFENSLKCTYKIDKVVEDIIGTRLDGISVASVFHPFMEASSTKECEYSKGAACGIFKKLSSDLSKIIGSFLDRNSSGQLAQVCRASHYFANQERQREIDKICEMKKSKQS